MALRVRLLTRPGVLLAAVLASLAVVSGVVAGVAAKTPPQKVKTAAGVYTIDGVLLADRFPPGCTEGIGSCELSNPGFRVLIVWLKAQRGAKPSKFEDPATTKGVYIKSASGARTGVFSAGLMAGSQMVAFTPRTKHKGFTLYWPGNKPIVLPKPVVQLGPA